MIKHIKIIKNQQDNSDVKQQIKAILHKCKNSNINNTDKWKDHNSNLQNKLISILKISKTGYDYNNYYDILCSMIDEMKKTIQKIIDGQIMKICPFQSILLYYMIQTTDKGIYSNITINELYNIIDIYSKSFNKEMNGHEKCLCKKYFCSDVNKKDKKIESMNSYLVNHYEKIKNLGGIYINFLKKFPDVNWLINHTIYFSGYNKNFIINKEFKLIGYNNDSVFIIYIKPQFNNLNYNDTLINSIFDTFLINNIKKPNKDEKDYKKRKDDFDKFNNKKILSFVFSLDNNKYYSFDWLNDKDENLVIKNNNIIIKQIQNKLFQKYSIESKYIYNFFQFWKNKILNNNLNEKPKKIIKKIISEYNKLIDVDKMPHFIIKFLENIERDIKENKKNIILKYDNKEYFINILEDLINESINEYLNIDDDEDNNDDN